MASHTPRLFFLLLQSHICSHWPLYQGQATAPWPHLLDGSVEYERFMDDSAAYIHFFLTTNHVFPVRKDTVHEPESLPSDLTVHVLMWANVSVCLFMPVPAFVMCHRSLWKRSLFVFESSAVSLYCNSNGIHNTSPIFR